MTTNWHRGIVMERDHNGAEYYASGYTQGGLGVARSHWGKGYAITHLNTGYTICKRTKGIPTLREALLVAEQLLTLEGLWTSAGEELAAKMCQPEVEQYVVQRLHRLGYPVVEAGEAIKSYKE